MGTHQAESAKESGRGLIHMKSTRTRFLVISYDVDRQQAFYDLISVSANAEDPENDAKEIAGRLRPYAVPCDTFLSEELDSMASRVRAATDEVFLPFHAQVKDLSRETCIDLLDDAGGVGVRDEQSIESLREEVRELLEDGTIDAEYNDLYIQ